MSLLPGTEVRFVDADGVERRAQIVASIADGRADVAVYDKIGRIEYGVVDAAQSQDDRAPGTWWLPNQ